MEKTSLEDAKGVIISASDYLYFQKLKEADMEDKDHTKRIDDRMYNLRILILDKYADKIFGTPPTTYRIGQLYCNIDEIYSMSDEEFKAYILEA